MRIPLKAIEVTGIVDEEHRLHLDEPLSLVGPGRVRVIILVEDTEISEEEWLHAVSKNPAFDFLKDPREDIYTIEDGQPFNDQG